VSRHAGVVLPGHSVTVSRHAASTDRSCSVATVSAEPLFSAPTRNGITGYRGHAVALCYKPEGP